MQNYWLIIYKANEIEAIQMIMISVEASKVFIILKMDAACGCTEVRGTMHYNELIDWRWVNLFVENQQ